MLYIKLFLLFGAIGAIGGGYAYHQVTVSKLEAGIATTRSKQPHPQREPGAVGTCRQHSRSITQSSRRER